jgi:3-hydroxyacyl-CoA dehydrogenase
VIGHHFFAPPHDALLEVVRGKATGSDVIASSMALARKLGKLAVLGQLRGFIGNRMYASTSARPSSWSRRAPAFRPSMPRSPSLAWPWAPSRRATCRASTWAEDPQGAPAPEQPGVRQRASRTACASWAASAEDGAPVSVRAIDRSPILTGDRADRRRRAKDAGISPRAIAAEEIVERTIYALVNEGARLLEEGMALRAGDIDVVYLYGYGFPAHRGGPLWYADALGLARVYERILRFESQYGMPWKPAPLLKALAEQRKTFADFDREKSG